MQFSDRVRRIIADIFEIPLETIQPTSSADNIPSWDSIRHLNMVLALEEEFGIQFEPEEIEELLTVELIEVTVAEKTAVRV